MGIRPGITTLREAISLLKNHPWVSQVQSSDADYGIISQLPPGFVYWDWKPDGPRGKHTLSSSVNHAGVLNIVDGRVNEITVVSPVTLGNLLLILGKPVRYRWTQTVYLNIGSSPASRLVEFNLVYSRIGLRVNFKDHCAYFLSGLWQSPVLLTFYNQPSSSALEVVSNQTFANEIIPSYRQICRH
jgi:hypothetical protein